MPRSILKAFALVMLVAVAAAAVPAPPILASSPSPSAAVAAGEPGRMVKQAFDLLMDQFVIPPRSADLLNGGWDGALAALKEKGVEDVGARPELGGDRERDWRAFAERYPRLEDVAKGKLEPGRLDQAIVGGMAVAMNEGHTFFLTPEQFRMMQDQVRNRERYGGIGVSVNQERRIIEVFPGSPAEGGGVKVGDQIVAVNGESVDGLTPAEASTKIRGEPGTPVEVTVRREGAAEPVVLTLVRAQIRLSWIATRTLDDGFGYLRIRSFPTPNFLGEFREAMGRFEEADVKGLVIDLRGNPGGVVDTGVEVASRFIKDGPLFQQIDRQGGQRTVTAFGDFWNRDTPVVLLVDGGSGSMSEILAAAMQENGTGRVIGTKTAGVVSAGVPYALADGSGLSVTVQIINSGRGKTLNGVGVEPDQTVELDTSLLRSGQDTQLDAAMAYLRARASARPAPSG